MGELIECIKTGENTRLEELLKAKPSLASSKTEQGISLLQFSAYCRNPGAIEILRTYENDLDIFEATCLGDKERLNHLLAQGPELINTPSSDGFSPMGLASFFGHMELVALLIAKGANPNIASNNSFKVTPLHSACAISNFEIAELLIKNGADLNARQMSGVTPLHSAAHNGQTRIAKLLIDNGAAINSKMDNGQTPLLMAIEKEFKETAEFLMKNGGL